MWRYWLYLCLWSVLKGYRCEVIESGLTVATFTATLLISLQSGVCYVGVPALYLLCNEVALIQYWAVSQHFIWEIMASSGVATTSTWRLFSCEWQTIDSFLNSHIYIKRYPKHASANDTHLSLWTALTKIVMAHSLIQITINLFQILMTKESR